MNVPTGYTALDMVGFTDKGTYNSATAYVKNDIAHYGGNLWRCLVDDTTGVTPTEGVNWTVFLAEPTSAAEDIIAQVETSSTAAHSYAVGKQLIYNDTLYTVTSAITVGDTLTVGTNITASDSIVDQLDTKANSSDLATVATTGAYSDLSGKPTLGTAAEKNVPASGDASSSEVVMGDDSRLTNARNAADVSAWAKAANKPTYNGSEIETNTAKTGTAQLNITDTVASGTTMDNVVGTMLNNDKTLDTNITSLNEALTNIDSVISANGAKNLLPNTGTDVVNNGISYHVNSNGSVSTSGSVESGYSYFYINYHSLSLKAGTYHLSGTPSGFGTGAFIYIYGNGAEIARDNGSGADFTLSSDSTEMDVIIRVNSGTNVTGQTFKPMITLASQPNSDYAHYVPYAMTNRELTDATKTLRKNATNRYLYSNNSGTFVADSSVTLSDDDWTLAEILMYTNHVDSGSRSQILVHKNSTTVGLFIPMIDNADRTKMAYFRPTSYSNKVLSFQTSCPIMIISVKPIV